VSCGNAMDVVHQGLPSSRREASRRTRLANERTYLAWWRTGLASFAVSIGIAKIVPAVTKGPSPAYSALGAGFAVVGLGALLHGLVRHRQVEGSLSRGQDPPAGGTFHVGMTVAGLLLGVSMFVLILYST